MKIYKKLKKEEEKLVNKVDEFLKKLIKRRKDLLRVYLVNQRYLIIM